MKHVYFLVALVSLVGWIHQSLVSKKERKYAYVSGCFEATSITFNATAQREFDMDEFERIDKICKAMYPEYLRGLK